MAEIDPSHSSFSYETSPLLFLFTSLTAGSSHIVSATSRLETILKANRIAFRAIDCATDEKARRIWSRRSGTRKLPGLVREGMVLADLETVEEWNEYGELKMQLSAVTQPPTTSHSPAPPKGDEKKENVVPGVGVSMTLPIREAQGRNEVEAPSAVHHGSHFEATHGAALRDALSGPMATRSVSFKGSPPMSKNISMHEISASSRGTPSGSGLATPEDPLTASAGPAKKSGLEAVTSFPETSDAAIAVEQQRGRGRAREEEDDGKKAEGAGGLKGHGLKLKFEEDQLKGDARDGRAAEDSVGD